MSRTFLFISVLTLFLVTYSYTAARLWRMLPPVGFLRFLLVALFVGGIAGIVLFFAWGERMAIPVAGALYTFGTAWLIAFFYLFMAVVLTDIFKLTNGIFHFTGKETITAVFRHNAVTSAVVFGAMALLLALGNIQYRNKKRVHMAIRSDKISQPVRIVGISDLHLGYTISARELQKWVHLINAEKPDMVVIAGDIIDNHIRPVLADSAQTVFRTIHAPMGVFACTGNHDLMFAAHEHPQFYTEAGITLLRDSAHTANGFTVIGHEDMSRAQRKSLAEIMQNVSDSTFTILLEHQPHELQKAEENGIDLQFSGHTHRGQVFPASLIADRVFERAYGYLQKGVSHIYVSSGIGIWGGKFRIGTRSEYVVFDIEPK